MRSMCEISKREQLVEYMGKTRHRHSSSTRNKNPTSSRGKKKRIHTTVLLKCNSGKGEMGSRMGATKKLLNPIEYSTHYTAAP